MSQEATTDEIHSRWYVEPRTIRILNLDPPNSNNILTGRLSATSLDVKPCYVAISCTWGRDVNKDGSILVDGRRMEISHGLEEALRSLRRPGKPRPVWVDSICVDQGDPEERNSQLRLIHEIYQQASSVLRCSEGRAPTPLHLALEQSINPRDPPNGFWSKSRRWLKCGRVLEEVAERPQSFDGDVQQCPSKMEIHNESVVLKGNALATTGSAAFPGTWHTDDWEFQQRGDQPSRLGRMQKLCILTLAPLPILVINKYAFDHGQQGRCFASYFCRILDNTTLGPEVNSIDAIGNLGLALAPRLQQLGVPHQFFEPSSNMFVVASLLLAGMLTSVPHDVVDHYPNLRQRIVLGSILAAILLGLTLKMSFTATSMYFIPWAAYFGTVISESVFACL